MFLAGLIGLGFEGSDMVCGVGKYLDGHPAVYIDLRVLPPLTQLLIKLTFMLIKVRTNGG